ncbi:MAG: hypothetical protein KAS78_03085 [Candidatus Pacebacteria bacterium]|nr:hypothetical protein [Candidatus Paceibacterota bacterium]
MNSPILDLIMLSGGLISIIGSFSVMKKSKSKLEPEQTSQDPLTDDENKKVYILAILNPIWAGLIFYFGWKKKLPIKAKKANRITFIAFGLWIIASVLIGWPLSLSA